MAIQFNNMAKVHFANAFMKMWYNVSIFNDMPTVGFSTLVSVHSGAQPTADDFITNWATYNSTNASFLGWFTCGWSHSNYNNVNGNLLQPYGFSAMTMSNAGVAAWAVIWSPTTGTTAPTVPQLASGTIPTQNIVVVPVSDELGNGIIRFVSTTLVVSPAPTPADGSFNVGW